MIAKYLIIFLLAYCSETFAFIGDVTQKVTETSKVLGDIFTKVSDFANKTNNAANETINKNSSFKNTTQKLKDSFNFSKNKQATTKNSKNQQVVSTSNQQTPPSKLIESNKKITIPEDNAKVVQSSRKVSAQKIPPKPNFSYQTSNSGNNSRGVRR